MSLQSKLEQAFQQWKPLTPEVAFRGKRDITLSWPQSDLMFLQPEDLLYRIERKEKIPAWVLEYSGGKTSKRIDNLAPCSPHKFRLRVIIKACVVSDVAVRAIEYYGSEEIAVEKLKDGLLKALEESTQINCAGDNKSIAHKNKEASFVNNGEGDSFGVEERQQKNKKKWRESLWSEDLCTSTDSEGTSTTCFCMAVRGGYLKQVQMMLEERPELINITNTTNGFTPLATAVRQGDLNMVRFLLQMGAEINQRSSTGQTPLHLAILASYIQIADSLLEKGADFKARDLNDLRVEHYAVDSGEISTLRYIVERGGDLYVRDNNGWTPLFRAICQGADTELIEELIQRGSEVDINDAAGLSLPAAARLLTTRHGRPREFIVRLGDSHYPHEKAVANFTRLTKKISSLHTLFKS